MTDRAARLADVGYDFAAEPKRLLRACPLCATRLLTTVAHEDRYGFPAQASFCNGCGVVFLNPLMTPDAYARFYVNVYRPLVSAYHGRRIDAESIQDEQREYAAQVGAFVDGQRDGAQLKSILDVGGSTGVVAAALAERLGAHATVIDPAPLETEVAQRLGLRTITGFVEDYEAGDERFDLVVLAQTIDHLLDAALTLRKIHDLLTPDGLFFVDIVDLRAGIHRTGSLVGALKIDHPFAFVEECAELHLARAGLDLVAKEYAPDGLHVRYLCRQGAAAADLLPPAATVQALGRELRRAQM
ncbi:MAG: class I SAM-dependent methyltransferase [Solirubrobacteraceae bacterium]